MNNTGKINPIFVIIVLFVLAAAAVLAAIMRNRANDAKDNSIKGAYYARVDPDQLQYHKIVINRLRQHLTSGLKQRPK